MLTGRGEEPDRIVGVELGGDDYLPKTFSTRELLARLRAVIRRSLTSATREEQTPQIQVAELTIDQNAHAAWVGEEAVQLTAVEFDLLMSLARAAGRVKTREQAKLLDDLPGKVDVAPPARSRRPEL